MHRKPNTSSWRYQARTAARSYPMLKQLQADLRETRITPSLDAYRRGSGSPARITEAAALRELPPAQRRQLDAVENALAAMESLPGAPERRQLVELVYFTRRFTIEGAALEIYVCARTGQQWSDDFLLLVWAGLCRAGPRSAQDRAGASAAAAR